VDIHRGGIEAGRPERGRCDQEGATGTEGYDTRQVQDDDGRMVLLDRGEATAANPSRPDRNPPGSSAPGPRRLPGPRCCGRLVSLEPTAST
jgi:hypothetical protein